MSGRGKDVPKYWAHRSQKHGPLRTPKRDLEREARALYREECGHDPSPRQLKRWTRQKNAELRAQPGTDVLVNGGKWA